MRSDCTRNVHLAAAANEGKPLEITLDDAFFSALEQDEITGGRVSVSLLVSHVAEYIYKVSVRAEGEVGVQCDRCLDTLTLPVSVEDEVRIKHGAAAEDDAPDMLYMDVKGQEFDFGWTLYEIIETSLPLNRVHPDGECNEQMLGYIVGEADGEE